MERIRGQTLCNANRVNTANRIGTDLSQRISYREKQPDKYRNPRFSDYFRHLLMSILFIKVQKYL